MRHLLKDFDAVPFTNQLARSHQPGRARTDHRLSAQRAVRFRYACCLAGLAWVPVGGGGGLEGGDKH